MRMNWCEAEDWRAYFQRLLQVQGSINLPKVILATKYWPWEASGIAQGLAEALGNSRAIPDTPEEQGVSIRRDVDGLAQAFRAAALRRRDERIAELERSLQERGELLKLLGEEGAKGFPCPLCGGYIISRIADPSCPRAFKEIP